jgi:hypothetical protein
MGGNVSGVIFRYAASPPKCPHKYNENAYQKYLLNDNRHRPSRAPQRLPDSPETPTPFLTTNLTYHDYETTTCSPPQRNFENVIWPCTACGPTDVKIAAPDLGMAGGPPHT